MMVSGSNNDLKKTPDGKLAKRKSKRSEMVSGGGNRASSGVNGYSLERRTFDAKVGESQIYHDEQASANR